MVEKFRKVSYIVWICFEAVVIENKLKEECTNKNNFDDNYNSIIVTQNYNNIVQFFNFERTFSGFCCFFMYDIELPSSFFNFFPQCFAGRFSGIDFTLNGTKLRASCTDGTHRSVLPFVL